METNNQLVIIRKIEKYIEYMLTILIKLPRTEKFSIGTEIKKSMYDMLKNILYATKIEKKKRLEYYNIVDSNIYYQRICIRIMIFELNLESELLELADELKYGKYKTFKIFEPKERDIQALPYRDRVVHQWYVKNFMKPYFVLQFIETSYAGIINRGMHKAAKDVQK